MKTHTTQEAAEHFGVTEKTIRAWIAEGMPVEQRGRQGGESHQIDITRAMLWRRKCEGRVPGLGEHFLDNPDEHPCGGNFLRWLLERYHRQLVDMVLARVLSEFATGEPSNRDKAGISQAQAKQVAWRLWTLSKLYANGFLAGEFEKLLERDTQADLDQWARMLFCADISSEWSPDIADMDALLQIPEEIEALIPKDVARRVAKRVKAGKGAAQA